MPTMSAATTVARPSTKKPRGMAGLGLLAMASARTENSKLTADHKARPVSVTYASHASCPTDCAFHPDHNGGCYGATGPIGFMAKRMRDAAAEQSADTHDIARAEAASIRALPGGRPLRLHGYGDCRTDTDARIVSDACTDYDGDVWTYTHPWRTVARESWGNVSVLASCETEQDVIDATARGYAVELTVPSFDGLPSKIGGLNVIPCPQQTVAKADCASCMLCSKGDRLQGRALVALRAHAQVSRIRESLAARNASSCQ